MEFELLEKEFEEYNPLIFDLNSIEKTDILGSIYDVRFSNSICFPEFKLGFHHFIHKTKDKMEVTEEFSNRKKIYLVTSLFEKTIDFKEKTDKGILFTSIDQGIKSFIKSIKPDFPQILNRAFLKLWEILIEFDLIPQSENFVSSHLAEGPGSFIQATILYREMMVKMGKIKSCSKDNYYGVTLHSDHEHLLMHQEFIKYFNKESNKRLHIMETKSINELKDLYGGGKNKNLEIGQIQLTNGDLTKLNTINQFAGGKNIESFSKPSDLITSDGGFDWKRENLQEQESYKLIFGEIVSALKIQKDGGNFVIKIFEIYTRITVKLIQMLRQVYSKVFISKPYTSRISNSEKYIVCKGFKKSLITSKIISKLEDQIQLLNKNENYQILDIFSEIVLSDTVYNSYKKINLDLSIKQYIGINNIIKFINLDNYNGIEFNQYIDKQIIAAHFWNSLFLEPKKINQIVKYFKTFDYVEYKKKLLTDELIDTNKLPEINKLSDSENLSESEKIEKVKKSNKTTLSRTRTIKKNQKGGNKNESSDIDLMIYDNESINSSDALIGNLDSDYNDSIDLNNLD